MRKDRNPEFFKRDLIFAHACEKCARASRCAFKTSPEGPEEVCWQLVIGGTYNCESCVRHNINGGCTFKCIFAKELVVEEAPVRNILHVEKKSMHDEFAERNHVFPKHVRLDLLLGEMIEKDLDG
jgi:hypothetical protein